MVSQPSELSSIFFCICDFDNLELINLQYNLLFNAFEIFLLIHSLFFPVKEKQCSVVVAKKDILLKRSVKCNKINIVTY